MAKRYIGAYVSSAGGIYKALENGEALNINTILMHPTPPQRWNSKPFDQESIEKFNEKKKESSVEKVFMHGIYLINLANPDNQKHHLSKMSLVYYLDLCAKVNANGVMFHTGSTKDTTEEEGLERVVYGLNWIFDNLESELNGKKLLLEIAAGAGNVVGDRFEELQKIYEKVKKKEYLGFCLDTQHMWASGYDFQNNLEDIVSNLDSKLGIENVKCVHFNDSKTELASHRDRHENLGEGLIGEKAMKSFLNHPKLKDIPFVMETPALKDVESSKKQVDLLKSWAEE